VTLCGEVHTGYVTLCVDVWIWHVTLCEAHRGHVAQWCKEKYTEWFCGIWRIKNTSKQRYYNRTDVCVLQRVLAEGIRNIGPRVQVLDCAETEMPRQYWGVQKCAPARLLPSCTSLHLWPAAGCSSPDCRDPAPEVSLLQQTLLRSPLAFPLHYKV